MATDKRFASGRIRATLYYPKGWMRPLDFMRFVQVGSFEDDWERLRLDNEDLRALENLIMLGPDRHPVVAGTGSLRKIRFSSSRWGRGKSGGVRVGYAHFPEFSVVLLLVAYTHDEQDNLTPEQRKEIREYLQRIGNLLAKEP